MNCNKSKKMRYTTLIDISEIPEVYKNQNARLLYLHLVLKAGYHDHDRDWCKISIRRLSADVGITVAAVRHALAILQKYNLLVRQKSLWRVQKYILQTTPTPRPKKAATSKEKQIRDYERQQQEEREKREQEERQRLADEKRRTGKTSFQRLLDELQEQADKGDIEAARKLAFWTKTNKK